MTPDPEPARPRGAKLAALRFRCLACGGAEPAQSAAGLACPRCRAVYPLRDGKLVFQSVTEDAPADRLARLKARFKRHRRLYQLLVRLISPLYFDRTRARFLAEHVRGRPGVFLNLGSGNTLLDPRVVNVDITPYDSVDVLCDVTELPLADGAVDGVLAISVLEHVQDPERVVAEIARVLRPGGWVYTDVPFVVGFHAAPHDYKRWTYEGILHLHRGFEDLRVVVNGGPTSALLWILQEWIALAGSFGSKRLHMAISLLVMGLTFPLKFLDVLLKHGALARNISSCFILTGRKPAGEAAHETPPGSRA
jgi:SAM-dependent methyltransferase